MSAGSFNKILFVDYENTGKIDLGAIPADVFVPFFFGASQKSVPTEFFKEALKLRDRFLLIDIEGQGKNALDFHIAFYLGEYLAANSQASCIILSKDKGFDPLVAHLSKRKFSVRRAATLAEAFGTQAQKQASKKKVVAAPAASKTEPVSSFALVVEWLSKMEPRTRPQKRKKLISYLYTHFGKKIPEAELNNLVDRLIGERKLREEEGKLAYQL